MPLSLHYRDIFRRVLSVFKPNIHLKGINSQLLGVSAHLKVIQINNTIQNPNSGVRSQGQPLHENDDVHICSAGYL